MTLQEAKKQIALKEGFNSWAEFAKFTCYENDFEIAINEAAELYAEAKAREAWNNAIDAAAEAAELSRDAGQDLNGISVDKQSILNLKK